MIKLTRCVVLGREQVRTGRLVAQAIAAGVAVAACLLSAPGIASAATGEPLGWRWQNPVPGAFLNCAYFLDPSRGWAVGTNGMIVRTTDGGSTWHPLTAGSEMQYLTDVCFIDQDRGWVVERGAVMRTTDGGETWIPWFFDFDDSGAKRLFMITPSIGWASGWGVHRTVDGGVTWQTCPIPVPIRELDSDFIDESTGWIFGDVYHHTETHKTTDGGSTWTRMRVMERMSRFDFTSRSTGWGVAGCLYKTTDGGSTWTTQSVAAGRVYDVEFLNPMVGWVRAHVDGSETGGVIYKTVDGGATWTPLSRGPFSYGDKFGFITTDTAWAISTAHDDSNTDFSKPFVFMTNDDWGSLGLVNAAATETLYAVEAIDASSACAVGEAGAIVRTDDGGATWAKQVSGTAVSLVGVCAPDTSTAWAVGSGGVIRHTVNGGVDWGAQASGTLEDLKAVDAPAVSTVWAVGKRGVILRTTNGGLNWDMQSCGATGTLYDVRFVDANTGWVVGDGGIWKTSNGGGTWTSQEATTMTAVAFVDPLHGWAAGKSVMRTVDGGDTWAAVATAPGFWPGKDLDFVTTQTGFLVTPAQNGVYRTDDGGATWTQQRSNDRERFPVVGAFDDYVYSVSFADDEHGWVVGDSGTIVKTCSGGVPATMTRVGGSDRYAVAAGLAKHGWLYDDGTWAGLTDVIVACGETGKEADPLAAAGLAGVYECPILLVRNSSTIPAATSAVIRDIAAANSTQSVTVHVIGGTASVPAGAVTSLKRLGSNVRTTRISGADRYAVTANIATRMKSVEGTLPGAIIICAEKPGAFYDALAASPIAYTQHYPILGVKTAGMTAAVGNALRSCVDSEGPRYAASAASYIGATAFANAKCVSRLATSTSRYVAATQITDAATESGWLTATDTGVTAKLSDALGGGAFMGRRGGVLLYTDSSTSRSALHPMAWMWVTAHEPDIHRGWILGGAPSVPENMEGDFRVILHLLP